MSTVISSRARPLAVPAPTRWRWVIADVLAILLLAALATVTFAPAYGTAVWRAALGGAVLGTALGTTAALRRWPVWLLAAAVVAAYFVGGGALAMPATATAGVLPNPATLVALAGGIVTGWKTMLTVAPPVGELGALLAIPYAVLLVATAAAGRLALDRRRATTAWLPLAGAGVLGTLFGLHTAAHPLLVGLGFALGVPVWTAYRRSFLRQALVGRAPRVTLWRAAAGAAVLAVAGGVAAGVLPLLRGVEERRVVLRDLVEPPVDVRQWPSPLQEMRAQVIDRADRVLLTAEGLPAGARVRLATLDAYDGTTYNASNETDDGHEGAFRRVGEEVSGSGVRESIDARITVADYAGVWVPTVGDPRAIRFTGDRRLALKEHLYLNRDSRTAVTEAGLRSGDALHLTALMPPAVAAESLTGSESANVVLPPLPVLPEALKERAARAAEGARGDGDTALRIQAELRKGYYSHGDTYASLPGHSLFRINQLFTAEQMVGDEEQYAVAFALMAREVGLPARVVYGFAPTAASGSVELRGRDVTAWVEVKYAEQGWVAYDAAPDHRRTPPTRPQAPAGPANPQVDNPPPPPDRPDRLPPDQADPEQPGQNSDPKRRTLWARYGFWVAAVGGPLAVLLLPVALVVGAKVRRRRVRFAAPVSSDRVAGGWAEVVDRARDLGLRLAPSATRVETARAVHGAFARSDEGVSDPMQLAFRADATTFGTGQPSARQADEFWVGVRSVLSGMTRSVTPWRRIRGALSLRSLRAPSAWRREAAARGRLGAWWRRSSGRVRSRLGRGPVRR